MLITIIILATLVIFFLILGIVLEPEVLINTFQIRLQKFKIKKAKDSRDYYLAVKVLWRYYYIRYSYDMYFLCYSAKNDCIKYSNSMILKDQEKIFNDRYNIIKYFSPYASPQDSINL